MAKKAVEKKHRSENSIIIQLGVIVVIVFGMLLFAYAVKNFS